MYHCSGCGANHPGSCSCVRDQERRESREWVLAKIHETEESLRTYCQLLKELED